MPQAANLTLNNAAATAKTFTLLSPAAGYNSLAQWALKEGTVSSVFARIGSSVKRTINKASKVELSFRFPSAYTDSTTGLTKAGPAMDGHMYLTIPDDYPESAKADAVAYIQNLFANALIKQQLADGTPMA